MLANGKVAENYFAIGDWEETQSCFDMWLKILREDPYWGCRDVLEFELIHRCL